MRKTFLILTCLLPAALAAQSIVSVPPQRCVWRNGDDPSWAAPDLDESGWQHYAQWKLNSDEPRIWVRCHLNPAALGNLDHPAVQIRMATAYDVFLNGVSIARNGNPATGNVSMNLTRVFAVPRAAIAPSSNLLALRIARRYVSPTMEMTPAQLPEIRTGDESLLWNDRAGTLLGLVPETFLADVPLIVLGIIGFVLLGFSLPDRTRPEPILLAVSCILVGLIFVDDMCGVFMTNVPADLYRTIWLVSSAVNAVAQYRFYFLVAQKRMPLFYRSLIGVWIAQAAWGLFELMVPLPAALRLDGMLVVVSTIGLTAGALLGTAPFVAFWPWSRIPSRMRTIAGFCMIWGFVMAVFFGALAVSNLMPRMPDFFSAFLNALFPAQAIVELCVVAAIVALLLRDQRQTALERASLAGEMLAAQKMQRALVPASIDTLPGLQIGVAFHPAREVGGDFYRCRILSGNRQRVLLGDVSGKGAAAAMAATLLLGAAEDREDDSPPALLNHLNRVLCRARIGGFATCLCADIAQDGTITLANAGHLAPYHNGRESKLDSGLPLGILLDSQYTETTLRLEPGATLTFLSDGVVEARNAHGELFGFERTAAISAESAENIARAASAFGQEDDITVLALTFAPAEVLHA